MRNILTKDYYDIFDKKFRGLDYSEKEHRIVAMPEGTEKNELMYVLCDNYLEDITAGYTEYTDKNKKQGKVFDEFIRLTRKLQIKNRWFLAIAYFFNGEHEKFLKQLNTVTLTIEKGFDEFTFVKIFASKIKNGFPGAWNAIGNFLNDYKVESKYIEICHILEDYYTTDNNELRIEILEQGLVKIGDSVLLHELLAVEYECAKKYRQSLSYYKFVTKHINQCYHMLYIDDIYFSTALMADHAKEKELAIRSYKKCLEIFPKHKYALNNMGYIYYTLRKYDKALACFQKCLEQEKTVKYAAKNYISTLCAMGKYDEANSFAENTSVKIPKAVLNLINKGKNKKTSIVSNNDAVITVNAIRATNKVGSKAIKEVQFSSEKLLEDELEQRLLNGWNGFGTELHIYNKEKYGRQYIIENVGRLDLLAEDNSGNLYIIELKKDSGYDDVYKQITEYMECSHMKEIASSKNIYGIICLNNPDKKLIDAVRKNGKIKLFNYTISYSEVK